MERKSSTSRSRREHEVIAAAAQVFYDRGYHDATIQDVADRLGILKGSLYYYIESKEDLLFSVMQGPYNLAVDLLDECGKMEGTVTERLESLLRGHIRLAAANYVTWSVFVNDFSALPKERQEALRGARRHFEAFVEDLLEEGKTSGEFRADLDVPISTLAILGAINWASRWYRPGGRHKAEDVADAFLALVLHGVKAG